MANSLNQMSSVQASLKAGFSFQMHFLLALNDLPENIFLCLVNIYAENRTVNC